ncbi:hypothetical protein AAES_73013 [Amazona aestiva]|uniref:Uncharacterized protein n=1 Tax=Amazona aestiva TaxID=12930 RepID=A0A0Q3MI42_AMAAE|nr:hypothetical protein AAES_73013 [Amazona aestiva]
MAAPLCLHLRLFRTSGVELLPSLKLNDKMEGKLSPVAVDCLKADSHLGAHSPVKRRAYTNSCLLKTDGEWSWIGHSPTVFFYTLCEISSSMLRMSTRNLDYFWPASGYVDTVIVPLDIHMTVCMMLDLMKPNWGYITIFEDTVWDHMPE